MIRPASLAKRFGLCAALLLSVTHVTIADAQQDSEQLQTVVVTAEKRTEKLQDVSAAVTAFSETDLQRMGVDNFRDVATAVPGASFVPTSNSTTKIVLRGISSGNNYDAASSATGLYLDDVPMGAAYGSGGTDILLVDLRQVEVLRGPQGTLYGAGSEGGTVKYLTNSPNLAQFSALTSVTGATTAGANSGAGNAVVNIPIVNGTFGVRAVGYYRNDSGYISDPTIKATDVNSTRISGGRLAALWDVNQRLSVSAFGLVQSTDAGAPNVVDINLNKQPLDGELSQPLSTIATPTTIHSAIVNFVINYDLDLATLTSSTSYTHFTRAQSTDDTSLALGAELRAAIPGTTSIPEVFSTSERSYVEEARLTSHSVTPFKWLVGLFYRNYTQNGERDITFLPSPGFAALDGKLGYGIKDTAAFGQASYDFSEQWELTLGGRYSHYTTTASQSLVGVAVGSPFTPIPQPEGTLTADSFTPKVELSFRPADGKLLYALASEGFRPGGPNLKYPAPIPAVPSSYSSDDVWNYELGAKSSWLDNRLTANIAVYDDIFNRLQVVADIPVYELPYLANAGKAKSEGVELEIQGRPIDGLTLSGTMTYDDARFTTAAPDLPAASGQRIPQVPEWTWTGAVDYDAPLMGASTWFAHGDFRYVGSSPTNDYPAGEQQYDALQLASYFAANARLGLDFGNSEAAFFVDNVTNVRGQLNVVLADATSPPNLRVTILQPRTFGIELTYRFR